MRLVEICIASMLTVLLVVSLCFGSEACGNDWPANQLNSKTSIGYLLVGEGYFQNDQLSDRGVSSRDTETRAGTAGKPVMYASSYLLDELQKESQQQSSDDFFKKSTSKPQIQRTAQPSKPLGPSQSNKSLDQLPWKYDVNPGNTRKNQCGLLPYKIETYKEKKDGKWHYYYRLTNLNQVKVQIVFKPVTNQNVLYEVLRGPDGCRGYKGLNYRTSGADVHYSKKLPMRYNLNPNHQVIVRIVLHGPPNAYHPAIYPISPATIPLDGSCRKVNSDTCSRIPYKLRTGPGGKQKNKCGLIPYEVKMAKVQERGHWVFYYKLANRNKVPVQIIFKPVTRQKVRFKILKGPGASNGLDMLNYRTGGGTDVHYLKKLPTRFNLQPDQEMEVRIELHGPPHSYHLALYPMSPSTIPTDGSCGNYEPTKFADPEDNKPIQKPKIPWVGYWMRTTKLIKHKWNEKFSNDKEVLLFKKDGTYVRLVGVINTPSKYSKGMGVYLRQSGKYKVDSSGNQIVINMLVMESKAVELNCPEGRGKCYKVKGNVVEKVSFAVKGDRLSIGLGYDNNQVVLEKAFHRMSKEEIGKYFVERLLSYNEVAY